jgi:hypothetical protein
VLAHINFLDAMDGMDLHIARYLMHEVHIPSPFFPSLVPLIDPRAGSKLKWPTF